MIIHFAARSRIQVVSWHLKKTPNIPKYSNVCTLIVCSSDVVLCHLIEGFLMIKEIKQVEFLILFFNCF